MPELICRLFLSGRLSRSSEADKRSLYGVACGISGIILNLLLFSAKLFAGILCASVSIMADAFNNLSDAGSSLVTLLGFKLSSRKADSGHPYGHGRFEYISALLVSMVIMIMGFELLKESAGRIISPVETGLEPAAAAILILSVLVKCYMAAYNRHFGKKIDSAALIAAERDSLSDCLATAAVLAGTLISGHSRFPADGICGILVSLFILYSGFSSLTDAIDPLLGSQPKKEYIDHIRDIVLNFDPNVIGIHDLLVHDYGPGRQIVSLHAEVPSDIDLLQAHDVIDNLEHRLAEELGCLATIHMDPVEVNDPKVSALRGQVAGLVKQIAPEISIHDFRTVSGDTHTNLVFDMEVPFSCTLDEDEIRDRASRLISENIGSNFYAVITIDRTE